MNICSDGHDEIVHDGEWRRCPLCAALGEIADKDCEIKELEAKVDELTEQLELAREDQ